MRHRAPAATAQLGRDAARLRQAVEYAQSNGSAWDFERDQVRTFGPVLGPLPKQRAATNGIILRHGYIVWHWYRNQAMDGMVQRVMVAITGE